MTPPYFPFVAGAALWLALLWGCARLGVRGCTRRVKLGFGVVTALSLFLPMDGLRVWSWGFSVCPNPSLPLLGLVCAGLWQRVFGLAVFKPADWQAAWIFGLVAGSVLYLHPMLFGAIDFYFWGWDREVAIACAGALAVAFLAAGNRFGVLLLAALIAYAVDALESANFWDYAVDPVYWLIGVVVTVTRGTAWCLARRRPPLPPPAGAESVLRPAA
jgi:hypothetical protein